MSSVPFLGKRRAALLVLAGIGVLGVVLFSFWPGRALPAADPHIVGTITALGGPPDQSTATILVEANPLDESGSAKGQLLVSRTTRIYRLDGTAVRRAAIGDLRIGQVVRVWHFGPVAESYPYQGQADVVLIVSEPQG